MKRTHGSENGLERGTPALIGSKELGRRRPGGVEGVGVLRLRILIAVRSQCLAQDDIVL